MKSQFPIYYKTENKFKKRYQRSNKCGAKHQQRSAFLGPLVDKFSYLVFDMIGLEEQRIRDWISLLSENWHNQFVFKSFQRGVGMMRLVY